MVCECNSSDGNQWRESISDTSADLLRWINGDGDRLPAFCIIRRRWSRSDWSMLGDFLGTRGSLSSHHQSTTIQDSLLTVAFKNKSKEPKVSSLPFIYCSCERQADLLLPLNSHQIRTKKNDWTRQRRQRSWKRRC